MTNMEKQAHKPRITNEDRDTARISTKKDQPAPADSSPESSGKKRSARLPTFQAITLLNPDENYVKKALERIPKAIEEICKNRGWTQKVLLDHLDITYFNDASTLSRIMNSAPHRKITADQLFELRRVVRLDLNALADGGPLNNLESLPDEVLIQEICNLSVELQRRRSSPRD